jgi:hypothetical protein
MNAMSPPQSIAAPPPPKSRDESKPKEEKKQKEQWEVDVEEDGEVEERRVDSEGKKITKPISEMSEQELLKVFKVPPGGKPSYDQKRILLGAIPVPPPGKVIPSFIDEKTIPLDNRPPTGLIYKDVSFEGAPNGIQELYRSWIAEFRKGMGNPKGQATLNILVQGPPGTGKTESIRYVSQDSKMPFWNIQGESLDPMALFGNWTKDPKTGKIVFEEGTLVKAVRAGGILLLDELNAFPQDVQIRLNSLLDDRRTLYLRETGEVIKANPELLIFATMNPPGEGTHDLIPQLKSRFQKRLWFPLPSESQQLDIVKARLQLSKPEYDKIEKDLQRSIRLVRSLNSMELSYQPTLREVVTMGRDLSSHGTSSLKPSLVSDFLDIYYDPDERKAVAEAIDCNFPGVRISP